MSDQTKLTLIVPESTSEVSVAGTVPAAQEDFEEQALPVPEFVQRIFSHKAKEVDLAPVKSGLMKIQTEVADLLSEINTSTVAGFRLSSVEVSPGISGGGTIGVVTAGVEASMSLTFERADH
jgi:hypothetical protein